MYANNQDEYTTLLNTLEKGKEEVIGRIFANRENGDITICFAYKWNGKMCFYDPSEPSKNQFADFKAEYRYQDGRINQYFDLIVFDRDPMVKRDMSFEQLERVYKSFRSVNKKIQREQLPIAYKSHSEILEAIGKVIGVKHWYFGNGSTMRNVECSSFAQAVEYIQRDFALNAA